MKNEMPTNTVLLDVGRGQEVEWLYRSACLGFDSRIYYKIILYILPKMWKFIRIGEQWISLLPLWEKDESTNSMLFISRVLQVITVSKMDMEIESQQYSTEWDCVSVATAIGVLFMLHDLQTRPVLTMYPICRFTY